MNFHTHSLYSDGKSTIKALVDAALKCDLQFFAITDHFTNSWKAKAISSLDSSALIQDYLEDISNCQEYLTRKNKSLHLYKGIEIDLGSSYDYIMRLISPENFDFILFEYLESFEGLSFIQELVNKWSSSDTLFGLAHFDPSYFLKEDYQTIIDFFQQNHIFYELNSRYIQYFSLKDMDFYQILRKKNIPLSIGTDAHLISRIDDFDIIYERISDFQLEKNVLEFLKLLK